MSLLSAFRHALETAAQTLLLAAGCDQSQAQRVELILNIDKDSSHGDISTTVALQLAKLTKKSPRAIAQELQTFFTSNSEADAVLREILTTCTIAGPGFLNFTFSDAAWKQFSCDLLTEGSDFFKSTNLPKLKVLVEFVSANPTGPLHLAHGRNAIIGDVLCSILTFLGHDVTREFYINDAGNQVNKLGASLKIRYLNCLGIEGEIPEGCYSGLYLKDAAENLFKEVGDSKKDENDAFFSAYAIDAMLKLIKKNLAEYGVTFDHWTSEKSIHQSGAVEKVVAELTARGMTYEAEGALWLRSTDFGDDKDRVLRKQDGALTYLAPDTAYYNYLLSQGYDKLVNVLGQDHHGYATSRNASLKALGLDTSKLTCLLYQLVLMKKNDVYVRMSKRAGAFEQLSDIIQTVGRDVARYFYLNRKADAHLELDLEQALKQNDENPVYYIHYAYVRTESLLAKAREAMPELAGFIDEQLAGNTSSATLTTFPKTAESLIKKILSLKDLLEVIGNNNQTHMLAYYTYELASLFHNFYAHTRIIVADDVAATRDAIVIVCIVRRTLQLCLDLLGLSKPKSM
jgi:arginyl-tRNA synthetase